MNSSLIKVSPTASVCALGKTLTHQLPADEASAGDIAVLLEQEEAEEMVRHFSSEFPCLLCTGTGQDTVSNSALTPDDDFYRHAQEFVSKDSEIGICNAFLKHSLPPPPFTVAVAVLRSFTCHNTLSSQMLCTIS